MERNLGNSQKKWKIKSTVLNNQWIKEEITGKLETFKCVKMKIQCTRTSEMEVAKAVLRGICIAAKNPTVKKKQDFK